jgi:hypothetical protein
MDISQAKIIVDQSAEFENILNEQEQVEEMSDSKDFVCFDDCACEQ